MLFCPTPDCSDTFVFLYPTIFFTLSILLKASKSIHSWSPRPHSSRALRRRPSSSFYQSGIVALLGRTQSLAIAVVAATPFPIVQLRERIDLRHLFDTARPLRIEDFDRHVPTLSYLNALSDLQGTLFALVKDANSFSSDLISSDSNTISPKSPAYN